MPKIPAELKPGISKYIAPEALFWFRYAALFTVITGLIIALLNDYLVEALTFQPGFLLIGLGMWLALIMAFNVWFVIWPNQKRARSEEHTSELQSLMRISYAVFCLKKTKT